ncbi:Leucine-rich repeat [Sergentomyia squamirostris]
MTRGSRKYCSYSEDDLRKAYEAVKAGMSFHTASVKFKVPSTTLFNKVSGKHPNFTRYLNCKSLTPEQELAVTQWVLQCDSLGHRVTRPELCNAVKVLCNVLNLKTRFQNDGPGKDWCRKFLKRNPILIKRMTRETGKELSPLDILQMRKLVPEPHDETANTLNEFRDKYGDFEDSVVFQTLKNQFFWPSENVKLDQ